MPGVLVTTPWPPADVFASSRRSLPTASGLQVKVAPFLSVTLPKRLENLFHQQGGVVLVIILVLAMAVPRSRG